MDLNTVRQVKSPSSADEVADWPAGHAWLSGGTWLMSEPQPGIDTLVDLFGLDWPPMVASDAGLEIAATATIGALADFAAPPDWTAAPLLRDCAHALLMSFKVAGVATVGGNICMSLPAGAMVALTVALEATYVLWPRAGAPRSVAAVDFVTGNHANVLRSGELLRAIHIPAAALKRRFALRRASLTKLGRSAALLIGTSGPQGDLVLTITAATPRPVQLRFAATPSAQEVQAALAAAIPADGWFDDVNGTPAYKRHLTMHFAEEIRAELAASGGVA
ncbi:FAD binding domain-containing protein [Xanthobacter oligotrophicus]|uniref:FAD binding domain-containing protein n=1 Tax=Xanthobacter oligotrophicus TaxID=2607286 RepID=UPI0011F3741A|nr:FAD binding domain-containing protein [Xanthobacter oligotrophicus]MCG5236925.1 FAD binding domain-containing protein [Xanthobacter oligotrophicus]